MPIQSLLKNTLSDTILCSAAWLCLLHPSIQTPSIVRFPYTAFLSATAALPAQPTKFMCPPQPSVRPLALSMRSCFPLSTAVPLRFQCAAPAPCAARAHTRVRFTAGCCRAVRFLFSVYLVRVLNCHPSNYLALQQWYEQHPPPWLFVPLYSPSHPSACQPCS